jgi:hypothetical protein
LNLTFSHHALFIIPLSFEGFTDGDVAPRDTVDRLKQVVGNNDKVIVLYTPEPFIAVGQFYEEFGQISDIEVKKIMKRHGYKINNDSNSNHGCTGGKSSSREVIPS